MDPIEVRLPTDWACLLINGDATGLHTAEAKEATATLHHLGLEDAHCIEITDETQFELAPSYLPWLRAGSYATYKFHPLN